MSDNTNPIRTRGTGRDIEEAYQNARANARHLSWKQELEARHQRESKPLVEYMSPLRRFLAEHDEATEEFANVQNEAHRLGYRKAKHEEGDRFFYAACAAASFAMLWIISLLT